MMCNCELVAEELPCKLEPNWRREDRMSQAYETMKQFRQSVWANFVYVAAVSRLNLMELFSASVGRGRFFEQNLGIAYSLRWSPVKYSSCIMQANFKGHLTIVYFLYFTCLEVFAQTGNAGPSCLTGGCGLNYSIYSIIFNSNIL
jgi:hypothetical protein